MNYKNFFALCLIAISCTISQSQDTLSLNNIRKAVIEIKDINKFIKYEKEFQENDSTPAPEGKNWFEVIEGSSKVIVTAPHATSVMRNGSIRFPDGGTGSLAKMLHDLCNVTVIYTTYLADSDPNYYDDNSFKDTLKYLLKKVNPEIVLDLHGSHPFRPYDIDFGTLSGVSVMGRDSLLDLLYTELKQNGFTNFSKDYFSASENQTITKWVYTNGFPCVQLEINSNWLMADREYDNSIYPQKTAQLLQALVNYIRKFDIDK